MGGVLAPGLIPGGLRGIKLLLHQSPRSALTGEGSNLDFSLVNCDQIVLFISVGYIYTPY
jgi:hypothetical protein